MTDIDLSKTYRDHYTASSEPAVVDIPGRSYLMIDGEGDPTTAPSYREAVEALYPIAYAIRSEVKKTRGDAYKVMPLEGLWWADDMAAFAENRDVWKWTLMILQPPVVTVELVDPLIGATTRKKQLAAGDRVRFEIMAEGLCAQILHVGPYSTEGPTIAKLHDFIRTGGWQLRGKHHEIYLGDPRKSPPEKLKTILRQPVG